MISFAVRNVHAYNSVYCWTDDRKLFSWYIRNLQNFILFWDCAFVSLIHPFYLKQKYRTPLRKDIEKWSVHLLFFSTSSKSLIISILTDFTIQIYPRPFANFFCFGKRIQIDLINDWNCYFHLRTELRWENLGKLNESNAREKMLSEICRSRKIFR